MTRTPKVAPHDSCTICFKGDTDTGVIFRGEAEFHTVALEKLGLSEKEAMGTTLIYCEAELGCDPGTVPVGTRDWGVRVCADCGAKAGIQVGPISAGELPCYVQPPDSLSTG